MATRAKTSTGVVATRAKTKDGKAELVAQPNVLLLAHAQACAEPARTVRLGSVMLAPSVSPSTSSPQFWLSSALCCWHQLALVRLVETHIMMQDQLTTSMSVAPALCFQACPRSRMDPQCTASSRSAKRTSHHLAQKPRQALQSAQCHVQVNGPLPRLTFNGNAYRRPCRIGCVQLHYVQHVLVLATFR